MTPRGSLQLDRAARLAGGAGWAALALAAALDWAAPAGALPAYRFAAFACLQPALGCLIFRLIHTLTGGQWGGSLLAPLAAGARLVPWIWPLIAWLALLPGALPSPQSAPAPGVLLIRAIAYEAVFIVVRSVALGPRTRWAGPALIGLVFTLHFLAADWFFTLEPGWFSSGFPIVWMSVQAAAGLAVAIVVATVGGADGSQEGPTGRPFGKDWGDLLLTALMFSSYVAFVELLIIWSGNLPREIAWYLRRTAGGWTVVTFALGLLHLALPFALLLFRSVKRRPTGVARVAGVVCAAEVLWAAWLILPPFGGRGMWLLPACGCTLLAAAGLFLNRLLAGVRRGETA